MLDLAADAGMLDAVCGRRALTTLALLGFCR